MESPVKPQTFPEWHAATIARATPRTAPNRWVRSAVFGIVIFLASLGYLALQGTMFGYPMVNRALAVTAVVLIGLSFALSGLCYFWNFVDTKIIYRRYIGVTGFFFGLFHGLASLYLYFFASDGSNAYTFFHVWKVFGLPVSNVAAFVFGLAALLIFIMMALISNRYATTKLGGRRWRQLLRVGYIALFFLIFHYGIKKAAAWSLWMTDGEPHWLPPISLVLFVFSLVVFGLRGALWVNETRQLHVPHPLPQQEKNRPT